jgi:hypothetical protein
LSYHRKSDKTHYWPPKRKALSGSGKGVKGFGHGHGDKYPGMSKNVDFHKSDRLVAETVFSQRSKRSQSQDLIRMATITPSLEVWLKNPNRYDFAGVDTPDPNLIFSHKTKRAQAADLARAAKRKVPLEVWIKDTAHADLKGVDTKNAKHVRKFKVVPKKTAEKAKKSKLEKQKELDHEFLDGKISKEEYERKRTGGRMPKKEEIIEKAQEIHKEQLAKEGLPALSATEQELKESGTFEEARADLMRGETTKADSAMLQYIDDLRRELEPFGFDIVEHE